MTAAARRLCLLAALMAAACGDGTGGLAVANPYGYLPPVQGSAAVAYLTIHNSSDDDIFIDGFESPLFAAVDLHETRLEDGVARMRPVARLEVPARGSATLAPGGMHLMLRGAEREIVAGDRVPLTAASSDGGRLDFEIVLAARGAYGGDR